jgi:cystathionine gamma-synthase
MAAHAASAAACAEFLRGAPGVTEVLYPGSGGMVSFRHPDAIAIAQRTKLFTLAESLGGVESLVEVPQAMTHQSVEGSAAAVPADLVRLSCGIEAPQDLAADVLAALRAGDQTDRV